MTRRVNTQKLCDQDVLMEDCTETHQAEINRKIKANDKLRQVLMAMPEEHRVLIYRESIQSKKFLAPQSRIEKQ